MDNRLLFTGQEYVEVIEKIPIEQRRWYQTAYLWYFKNAKLILLILAVCATIYTALVYRGLVAAAVSTSKVNNLSLRRRVMTGGMFNEVNDNIGAFYSAMQENEPEAAPKKEETQAEKDIKASRIQASKAATAQRKNLEARKRAAEAEDRKAADAEAKQAEAARQQAEKDAEARSKSAEKEAALEAELLEKRKSEAVSKALRGDRPEGMSETAYKNIEGAKAKIKGIGAATKSKYESLKQDYKSGKMKEQAKLMTMAVAANVQDTVQQHSQAVYTIIFTFFLVCGLALYFVPTVGMIGISILTFYMFTNFVRGIITL